VSHRLNRFEIKSDFAPTGDQPQAIEALVAGLNEGRRYQTLLGATGTGKTFTMANVIARVQKPTLIISHNKTLAAQLYEEMRELFPGSAVSYFVSYYDYYQPEAYIPQRDIYIEKDAQRNDDLDRLRLAATSNLLSRRDVIVVASVSCIYGLGSPEAYGKKTIGISVGQSLDRRRFLLGLSDMQYARNEIALERGNFRVRGDVIEVHPAYEQFAIRIELFGDEVERIELINPTSGEVLAEERHVNIFPAVHYVMPEEDLKRALDAIRAELDARVMVLRNEGKLLEAQRLLARTRYDLEMMEEVGYCSGIENYSAHLDGRIPGARPYCLLDYFRHVPQRDSLRPSVMPAKAGIQQADGNGPDSRLCGNDESARLRGNDREDDWLVFIDESHATVPQIRGMYFGDRSRKQVLVDHGFRLPSALDNRPLKFEEFEEIVPQVIYVSATPSPFELEKSGGIVAEQVIRPTGLLDPPVTVLPARGQIPDLLERCKVVASRGERVLVTALTKRLCEDLTNFLDDKGLKVRYLHSDIETLERLEILRDLREGDFDVLVGVNLLREGLDLPEVSLVAILDADKTGFLRSETSLIQTMGRAARNANSEVVMYADQVTSQMRDAMDETQRRRRIQMEYNQKHGITPETVLKAIRRGIEQELKARRTARAAFAPGRSEKQINREEYLADLEHEMLEAAARLEFEKAAALRDRLNEVRNLPPSDGAGAESAITQRDLKASSRPKPGMARSKAGLARGKKGRRR
jgi:excinuclease ABC subunit B